MKFLLYCCTSALLPLAASCGDGGGNADAGPVGNVVMGDQNSYTSTSSLTIPVVATTPAVDLNVCWTDLMKDILCHDVSATADIDTVSFLQIPRLSKTQIQEKLAKGTLSQNEVALYREFQPTGSTTCANLSTFAFGPTLVPATDYVTAADKTYMMLFSTGTTPGSGAKSMVFLDPVASSTNTMVAAPASGCDILTFQADLTTRTPLPIPTDGPWVVDWSQITKDSMGNKVQFQFIDSLMVGYYEGKTVADLQAMFKDIDRVATKLWNVDIPTGRKYMDLAMAKDTTGAAFPGFTGASTGVYAVALLCSTCQVPAPVALSILQPVVAVQ